MNQKTLKQLLNYDKDTGIFTWKISKGMNRVKVGNIAGTLVKNGYIAIKINGKNYKAHRLAWLYTYGEFPLNETDHINHIKDDNRINNLRVVTKTENGKNQKMHKDNTSGIPGVYWDKKSKKWRAHIRVDGILKYLGLFANVKNAKRVREEAKIKYGFHVNHA